MKTVKISTAMVMLALAMLCNALTAVAQRPLENTMSAYYANKMLWNPALTAAEGNKVYALQNRSWIGFQGAPVLTNVSGQVAFGKNSSVGVMFMNDRAGVLIRSYGLVNYGYRVKLAEDEQVRLGISFAFNSDRIDNSGAGMNDPVIYNNVKNNYHFDGNFGVMYQRKTLNVGFTVNRIRENLGGDSEADLALARIAGYYGLNINKDEEFYLEPMAMLRFYRGTSPIADLGAMFRYNKMINLTSVYQTTGNIRMGLGVVLDDVGEANLYYNTNHKLSNSNSRQYEIGIGIYFLNKKDSN